MKYITINSIFIALLLLLSAASAQSQSLSQANIDKYIKSIDILMNTDDAEIKAIKESFTNNRSVKFDTDGDGNIRIMSQTLGLLDSSQVDALSKVAKEAGFDSIKKWAAIGDKASAAMMAIEMENEPVDMSEMTPEMMETLPESMRQQIEGAMRLIKAADNVPAADIAIVKVNYTALQKLMDGNTK